MISENDSHRFRSSGYTYRLILSLTIEDMEELQSAFPQARFEACVSPVGPVSISRDPSRTGVLRQQVSWPEDFFFWSFLEQLLLSFPWVFTTEEALSFNARSRWSLIFLLS